MAGKGLNPVLQQIVSQDKSVQGLRRRNLRDEIFRWRSHCGLLLCRCPFPFILHFHLLSFSARREMFKIRQVKRPFTSTLCVDLGTIWLQNLNEFSENFWKSLLPIYLPKKVYIVFRNKGGGSKAVWSFSENSSQFCIPIVSYLTKPFNRKGVWDQVAH